MSRPDDLPPELLAGYADGELPPPLRARVEAWLADHPEFFDQLEAQEALGPGNVEFWRAVRPPSPARADWRSTRNEIASQLPRGGLRRWAGAAALLATAACLLVVFVGHPPPPCGLDVGLPLLCPADADDEPYPIARADEVRYLSLPESVAPLLLTGEQPLSRPLLLARADEVEFHGLGSDAAGRFPEEPLNSDPPVIWTPVQGDPCPE